MRQTPSTQFLQRVPRRAKVLRDRRAPSAQQRDGIEPAETDSMGTPSRTEVKHLRDLVGEHKAVFEVRPAYSVYTGERMQVGFDVELCGTHSQAVLDGHESSPTPGCERCVRVWEDLREIASAALPAEDRPSGYYIEAFQPAISYYTKRRPRPTVDRPDIELVIEIRHRQGFNREVDPCESRCLQDILATLKSLGVQEGTWNEYRAAIFQREHQAEDFLCSP
jgi:hypothetical protein